MLPALGFGVFQTPPDETATAVTEALRVGYRHIDTAAAYGNENGVGDALRASGLARDEVFVETKLWISDYGYDAALHGFEKSAAKLGVDQIDLLLLHQPLTESFDRTLDAYRALEQLYADGKVRAIGVSNFMPDKLTRLLTETDVVPAVNQIEGAPLLPTARAASPARRTRHPHPGMVARSEVSRSTAAGSRAPWITKPSARSRGFTGSPRHR
jgi:diketogulonate reductase-like aldo/keto reductase